MTKRWLSLVLVLTLLATCFAAGASAAPVSKAAGELTFVVNSSTPLALTADTQYTETVIGKIYDDSSALSTAAWLAIKDKLTATDASAGMDTVAGITLTLASDGTLKATFKTGSEAKAKTSKFTIATSASGYSFPVTAQVFYGIAVPVTGIDVKAWDGTNLTDATSTTIEATAKTAITDYAYRVYAGAKPGTANAEDRVISAVAADPTVVKTVVKTKTDLSSETWSFASDANAHLDTCVQFVGLKVGTSIVTISTANGKTKNVSVTVKATEIANASGVTLTPPGTIALQEGDTVTPTATFNPTYTTNKNLVWNIVSQAPASAGKTVIELTSAGQITAVNAGAAVIKWTWTGASASYNAEVNVTVSARSQAVATTPAVVLADVEDVAKNGLTEGGHGTSSSSAYQYPKTVTIKSATKDTTVYYTVDGTDPKTSATRLTYSAPFVMGETTKAPILAYAKYTGSAGYSDSAVVTTGVATGTQAQNNPAYGDANGIIYFSLKPTSLKLDKETLTVAGSTAFTLKATMTPDKLTDAAKTLSWSIPTGLVEEFDAADVCKLNPSIKATAPGKYTITASTQGSTLSASCVVTVTDVAVTGIALNKTSATLALNEKLALEATVSPANAFYSTSDITWQVGNATYFAVSSASGAATVVTAANQSVAVGSASTVTAKYKTTASASCNITIAAKSDTAVAPTFTVQDSNDKVVTGTAFDNKLNKLVLTTTTNVDATAIKYNLYKDGQPVGTLPATFSGNIALNENAEYYIEAWTTATGLYDSAIVSATYTVKVPVTSIEIQKSSVKVTDLEYTGKQTDALTVAVGTADAKDRTYTWTTSNDKVAVIYEKETTIDGVTYTADTLYTMGAGTTVITATAKDGSGKSASVNVKVNDVKVSTIAISPTSTGKTGESVDLNKPISAITINPTTALNRKLTWAITSGSDLATIDATTGIITYNKAGKVKVKASATDSTVPAVSNECEITISDTNTVANPVISPATANYTEAQTVTITCATIGANIYYTTDGSTPTATNGTLYTAPFVVSSTCTVNARAYKGTMTAGVASSVTLTITPYISTLTLTPSKSTVDLGDKVTLKVDLAPANAANKNFNLSFEPAGAFTAVLKSAVEATATYELTASEVAKFAGQEITITATAVDAGAAKGNCKVSIVKPAITAIEVLSSNETLYAGETAQLSAVITPGKIAQGVTWTTSDKTIATVATDGKVTGVNPGTATITATSVYDTTKKATIAITVKTGTPPTAPAVMPTFTEATTKAFEVTEGGNLVMKLGSFEAAAWDAVKYYYNVEFTITGGQFANTTLTGTKAVAVNDKGEMSLTVKNIARAATITASTFNYGVEWKLTTNVNQGINTLNNKTGSATGYTLKINEVPSADEKAVADAKEAIARLNATVESTNAKTEGEAKTALLAKLNAALAGTGITLTANDISISNFLAAVDGTVENPTGTPGSFNYTVTLKSGVVIDTVSAQATINPKPFNTKKEIAIASATKPYDTMYKKTPVKVLNVADGTVTFSVPGYTATNWKSSKPKYISIDAVTGVATLNKPGSTTRFTITCMVEGTKLTQVVRIQKIATAMKMQYKDGKKWIDFADGTAAVKVELGKKLEIRAVNLTGSKRYSPVWATSDSAVVGPYKKSFSVLKGKALGTATVSLTLYNDVKAIIAIEVVPVGTKGAIESIEEEAIVEIEEIEELDMIEELED